MNTIEAMGEQMKQDKLQMKQDKLQIQFLMQQLKNAGIKIENL